MDSLPNIMYMYIFVEDAFFGVGGAQSNFPGFTVQPLEESL